jgi:hypothetical protein
MGAIITAFTQQYSDMLSHLLQQTDTRLRGAVEVDMDFKGEYKFYDQLGQTAVVPKTTRHEDTPIIDPDHQRRRVTAADYVHAFLLDKEDELSMIINPISGYAQAQAMAFAREQDKIIYTGLLGTAYSGKEGATGTALSSYQSGAHVVTASSGMTVDKLLEVKQLLDLANNDPMIPRVMALTAYEIKDLLALTEVKSSDYNTVRALAAGQIDSFCGFRFIVLPPSDITNGIITRSSNVNSCVAFTADALKFAIKRDVQVQITPRPDKNYSTQVWAAMTAGSVRLQEGKVVQLNVTNAS